MSEDFDASAIHGWMDVLGRGIELDAAELLLRQMAIPCLIRTTGPLLDRQVLIRVPLDKDDRPVTVADRGSLRLQGIEWVDIAAGFTAISARLEVPESDGDGEETGLADSPEESDERDEAVHFVWITSSHPDVHPFIARQVNAPIEVVMVDKLAVVMSMGDLDDALMSAAWAVDLKAALIRRGDERELLLVKRAAFRVAWDENWRKVNPAPMAVGSDGVTCEDILEALADEPLDEAAAVKALGLDDEKAERFRILVRRMSSDPDTFTDTLEILGLPRVAADVIEGRREMSTLLGYAIVQPAGLGARLRALAVEVYDESSWFWSRFARSHPKAWFISDVVGILLSVALTWIGLSTGRVSGYIALAAIFTWTLDFVLGNLWHSARRRDESRLAST